MARSRFRRLHQVLRAAWTGDTTANTGSGSLLLAIPFYVAGLRVSSMTGIPSIGPGGQLGQATPLTYTITMLGMLATALSVALFYLCSRVVGFSPRASGIAALGLGLCTFAWYWARTFMSEPTSMFALLVAFYAQLRDAARPSSAWLLLAGSALAFAVLLRVASVIVLPGFGLWLLLEVCAVGERASVCAAATGCMGPPRHRRHWRRRQLQRDPIRQLHRHRLRPPGGTSRGENVGRRVWNAFQPRTKHVSLRSDSDCGCRWVDSTVASGTTGRYCHRINCRAVCPASLSAPVLGRRRLLESSLHREHFPFLMLGLAAVVDRGLRPAGWFALVMVALASVAVQSAGDCRVMHSLCIENDGDRSLIRSTDVACSIFPLVEHARSLVARDLPFHLAPVFFQSTSLAWFQATAFMTGVVLLSMYLRSIFGDADAKAGSDGTLSG